MLVLNTPSGVLEVPDWQVEAIRHFAHQQAELTAAALLSLGWCRSSLSVFSAGFLLEFAAILQLGIWEQEGLAGYLADAGLPSYSEAAAKLRERATSRLAELDKDDMPALAVNVLRVWVERFAIESCEYFDCQLLLSQLNDDAFVEKMAQFLWEHRHDMDAVCL